MDSRVRIRVRTALFFQAGVARIQIPLEPPQICDDSYFFLPFTTIRMIRIIKKKNLR